MDHHDDRPELQATWHRGLQAAVTCQLVLRTQLPRGSVTVRQSSWYLVPTTSVLMMSVQSARHCRAGLSPKCHLESQLRLRAQSHANAMMWVARFSVVGRETHFDPVAPGPVYGSAEFKPMSFIPQAALSPLVDAVHFLPQCRGLGA
eukprot:3597583-Rhodomonas_salina.2